MVRMETNAPMDKDDDRPSNTLDHFAELEEVLSMIDNLIQTDHTYGRFEKAYERYSGVLGRYQEQPHLLDQHLPLLLDKLLPIVRNETNPETLFHGTFKYLYQLSKVRTYKAIVKFLPHEVNDLDFVLKLVEKQYLSDSENWETRYFLLLWLSILVLNPFHMSRLDAFPSNCTETNENHHDPPELTKMERIFLVCTTHCNSNDACATMAAFLASKYVVRIDLKDKYLPKFLQWIVQANQENILNLTVGQLSALCSILKHGKREDLLPHANMLLAWCLGCGYKEISDFLKQKYCIKIIHRLGLVFLKPRLACWRYQRGSRSLTANLSASTGESIEFEGNLTVAGDDAENDMDVPGEIEDVIEELLQALRNPSGDIRWSAAKGLGRVTNRLSKSLGDQVVGSVIEIFSPLEPHEAWHGGCLAVAELAKRGLLLPSRLVALVPILLQAFVYDEMRGYMSVGQHIRDAACYVSWAFARAYDPNDLEPFIYEIATGLLVTTVFDREINCRRAASAAFQESVGRLGNFPHGIDILVAADFYSVGLRSNSYLIISDYIAQYEEYTCPLIDHLIEKKINHWDTAIRDITAKTLFKLTKRAPKYMAETVLQILFKKTDSIDVNLRHGSIISIGEISFSLSELEKQNGKLGEYLNESLVDLLNGLVIKLQKRDLFRGLSGDIMNQACCDFIRNVSQTNINLSQECLDSWQEIIDVCIIKKSPQIRDAAIVALQSVCESYYNHAERTELNAAIIEKYRFGSGNETEENIRMGYLSALGALPAFMIKPNMKVILSVLIRNSLTPLVQMTILETGEMGDSQSPNPFIHKWSEARRDSIKALSRVVKTIGFDKTDSESIANPEYFNKIIECLFRGLEEYTIDDRGDIGAWVREASMNALFQLVTSCPNELLTPNYMHTIMSSFAQQAVETIDRTRGLAGNLFCQLVYWNPSLPHIPHHDFLKTIFPEDNSNILWLFADHTFPMFCKMLALEEYAEKLILGLVVSIGKLTESLIKYSSNAMFQFLRSNSNHIPRICEQVICVFSKHISDSRVSYPFLNFLDSLFSSGTVNSVLLDENNSFSEDIFRFVKLEMKGQKNIYKTASCATVLCHLIQIPKLCSRILSNIAIFLGQSHVHVRKTTATKLYEAIVLHGDSTSIPEENLDDILALLSETDWGMPLTEIRPIRNNLCILLGIKPPVAINANS